ncbi:hypothetical protein KC19_VG329300 [Ceratodon purpureus]|uniref:Uncharacterized protein n=1 Tax=Ceratodon purpureus TaxID=3225 RepID=A0A8T0HXY9_CERPU|nr:hypothetical protein KC19_VG329300 [Ceratodon purpureus]
MIWVQFRATASRHHEHVLNSRDRYSLHCTENKLAGCIYEHKIQGTWNVGTVSEFLQYVCLDLNVTGAGLVYFRARHMKLSVLVTPKGIFADFVQ